MQVGAHLQAMGIGKVRAAIKDTPAEVLQATLLDCYGAGFGPAAEDLLTEGIASPAVVTALPQRAAGKVLRVRVGKESSMAERRFQVQQQDVIPRQLPKLNDAVKRVLGAATEAEKLQLIAELGDEDCKLLTLYQKAKRAQEAETASPGVLQKKKAPSAAVGRASSGAESTIDVSVVGGATESAFHIPEASRGVVTRQEENIQELRPVRDVDEQGRRRYYCPRCNFVNSVLERCRTHIRSQHSQEELGCAGCFQLFHDFYLAEQHATTCPGTLTRRNAKMPVVIQYIPLSPPTPEEVEEEKRAMRQREAVRKMKYRAVPSTTATREAEVVPAGMCEVMRPLSADADPSTCVGRLFRMMLPVNEEGQLEDAALQALDVQNESIRVNEGGPFVLFERVVVAAGEVDALGTKAFVDEEGVSLVRQKSQEVQIIPSESEEEASSAQKK